MSVTLLTITVALFWGRFLLPDVIQILLDIMSNWIRLLNYEEIIELFLNRWFLKFGYKLISCYCRPFSVISMAFQ